MTDFCILGSGVAGSTIASLLKKRYSVHVIEKARGPGGRASNKKLKKNFNFDHGVQYISPKSQIFTKYINKLVKKKLIKKWEGNHLDFTLEKKIKSNKFIGKKANNDFIKYQLKKIKQTFNRQIIKIERKNKIWEVTLNDKSKYFYKSIILTCPFPQLKKLAKKYLEKKMINLDIRMEPNITTMIAIKNQNLAPVSSLKFNDNILAWASHENSKKRFNTTSSLWTLQSTTSWATKMINKYKKDKKIENILVSKFIDLTGYKKNKIIFKKTHGWKYSYNLKRSPYKSYWNNKLKIGVCADWFIGPKVESAWLSANDLAKKIK